MTISEAKIAAVIDYLERELGAAMVKTFTGYIMVTKSKNNCRNEGMNHTKNCDSGVNCVCPEWEFGE